MSWGYVAVAAATVIGGAMSNKASKDAAKSANAQDQKAIDEQRRQFDLIQQNLGPYMQYGTGAGGLGGLAGLLNGSSDGFMNSSWYKAGIKEANNQFNNGAAAKFRLFSGGAQNDRDQLNQDYALTHGIAPYASMLQWGANLGQNAAAGVGQAGQNSANQISSIYGNMGQTNALNSLNQGQNNANMIGGLGSLLGQYLGKSSYGGNGVGQTYNQTYGSTGTWG